MTEECETYEDGDDRPEPFATVLDLVYEYGIGEVLVALSGLSSLDSEDENKSAYRRAENRWLRLELKQLVEWYEEIHEGVRFQREIWR
jgi:hypothetical protein